jgi:hypothetical protein
MKLPNPNKAIIDRKKLLDYCLNPNHSDGRHKARVFESALGLNSNNVEILEIALLESIKKYDAMLSKQNKYGQKYIVDFSLVHNNKQAVIHSVWIIKNSENFPRLVTCYVL